MRAMRNMMVIAAFVCAAAFGGENEIAKWDPRMALKDAVVTNGVKWIDGTKLWKNLVYLPKDKMYSGDAEGTVDGCHPNDLGMETMAAAFGAAVRQALK